MNNSDPKTRGILNIQRLAWQPDENEIRRPEHNTVTRHVVTPQELQAMTHMGRDLPQEVQSDEREQR
jgi:hypothetical protein